MNSCHLNAQGLPNHCRTFMSSYVYSVIEIWQSFTTGICIFDSSILTVERYPSPSSTESTTQVSPFIIWFATKLEISIYIVCSNWLIFLKQHRHTETIEVSWVHKEDIKCRLKCSWVFGSYIIGLLISRMYSRMSCEGSIRSSSLPRAELRLTNEMLLFFLLLLLLSVDELN